MTTSPQPGTTRRQHTGTPIPEPTVPDHVDVIRDVSFGPHERQSYDVYLPRGATKPLPVVVFMHPGAWMRRDKRAVRVMFALDHGFAVVSIGYRLAQHAQFPAQVQDVNAGLRHLLDHAAEYGIDPERMVLSGTSAGAHLAALTVLARDVPAFDPVESLSPRAVVAVYGAYDMPALIANQDSIEVDHTGEESPLGMMTGGLPKDHMDTLEAMSPMHKIRADAPPFYVLHGMADHVLPWRQSADFAAALAQAGVVVRFDPVPGAGHGDERFRTPPISDRIVDFIKEMTRVPG
ncbi:alpha/beta hydrolase fold domain-containing protein [Nioella sp.]|uniref:alpha/beta hydrolase fold domain-containing protein n=1 Tax=Nioella sp. TaxID=1912091 RepID=UPI0035130FA8